MKNFCLLSTIVIGYFLGIHFYRLGFLLTRTALLMNSTCIEVQAESTDACWTEPRFKRAVLIIIDALRYDFVVPLAENRKMYSHFYHNKLRAVQTVLQNRTGHSLLYKFVADPPTTTLQRLKALTTGSLPTFIDAGSNFAGAEIEEDNLIDQFTKSLNRKIVFMGDDTWISLFPNRFLRKFDYPSFDTTDLHTVDDGILQHLMPELMNGTDWHMLIAHFLGVDHCGHKFGPSHPEMSAKLNQLDAVLKEVMENLRNDTILFVLGDHGMTQTGDHGGDSSDELNAALFVYSPSKLHDEPSNVRGSVSQIDLVPTLSMLLDFPTPFSNLGSVIVELFPDYQKRLQAARANVWQVVRYTENYLANCRDGGLIDKFQPILQIFYSLDPDELTVEKCIEFIHRISAIFVECWAKFHLGWMTLGLLTILETFLWSLSLLVDKRRALSGRKMFLKICIFVFSFLVLLLKNETVPPALGFILTAQVVLHLHTNITWLFYNMQIFTDFWTLSCIFLLILHGLGQFSNSFVVYDDLTTKCFCQTLLIFVYLKNFLFKNDRNSMKITEQQKKQRKKLSIFRYANCRLNFKALIYTFSAMALLRTGQFFNRCREEQVTCESSIFTVPFASLLDADSKIFRFCVSVCGLVLFWSLPRWFLQKHGHLHADAVLPLFCQFGTSAVAICVFLFWYFPELPKYAYLNSANSSISGSPPIANFNYINNVVPNLPLLVYGSVLFSLLYFFYDPLLTYIIKVVEREQFPNNTVQAFNHLKTNWQRYFKSTGDVINKSNCDDVIKRGGCHVTNMQINQQSLRSNVKLYIFGAATIYSGSFLTLFWCVGWLILMLLGDGVCVSVAVFLLILCLTLELTTSSSACGTTDTDADADKSADRGTGTGNENYHHRVLPTVLLLTELSTHFFYAFGHHATFSAIPWDAAFVGVVPAGYLGYRLQMCVQAVLVILHLSASNVLVIFALPLFVGWGWYKNKTGWWSLSDLHSPAKNDYSTNTTATNWVTATNGVNNKNDQPRNSEWSFSSTSAATSPKTEAEYFLNTNPDTVRHWTMYYNLTYLTCTAFRLLCVMLASAIHRRHLMVWKIFAPKFIFDGILFIVTCLCLLFQYLFVLRFSNCLHKFLGQLKRFE